MSYSKLNPAWNNLQRSKHDARIQDEIRLARDMMHAEPGLTYAQALRRAIDQLNMAHHKATFL